MKTVVSSLLLVLVLAPLAARAETLNRIVATIDGDPITLIELERYAEVAKKRPGGDQVANDQRALLDELVLDKIITKQVDVLGLKASEQQIDNYIESIRTRNNLSEQQLMDALKQQGMSWDQYRIQVRADIERANLINREIRNKVNVSPEEVERYYQAHLDQYGGSGKMHARLISLTVPPDTNEAGLLDIKVKADEVRALAADGKDFAKLVKEYSQGPAVDEGGDIGEIQPDQMQTEFAKAVADLKPGEVSQVISTRDGFHIIKIDKQTGDAHQPLAEVSESIKEKLYKEAMEQRYDRWLNQDLRSRYHVEILL
jgi:peptidyl-prolyl cis-trans isomerase SurA